MSASSNRVLSTNAQRRLDGDEYILIRLLQYLGHSGLRDTVVVSWRLKVMRKNEKRFCGKANRPTTFPFAFTAQVHRHSRTRYTAMHIFYSDVTTIITTIRVDGGISLWSLLYNITISRSRHIIIHTARRRAQRGSPCVGPVVRNAIFNRLTDDGVSRTKGRIPLSVGTQKWLSPARFEKVPPLVRFLGFFRNPNRIVIGARSRLSASASMYYYLYILSLLIPCRTARDVIVVINLTAVFGKRAEKKKKTERATKTISAAVARHDVVVAVRPRYDVRRVVVYTPR